MIMTFPSLIGLLVVLPMVCLTAIVIAAIMGFGRRGAKPNPEETRLVQEMHRSLEKLETRIESLETIILELDPRHGDGGTR